MLKIIDFVKKGNVIRFYLGDENCQDYWGDDWNDAPYEHNAGTVYDKFVTGILDIAVPFDCEVDEPSNDWTYNNNSPFCKEDFKNEEAPCLIISPEIVVEENFCGTRYTKVIEDKRCMQIYYNTLVDEKFLQKLYNFGCNVINKRLLKE